ncbi:hypothetical protein Mapa_017593 [Marchantia paleacea]|nr:hypothetical protein Mapa_017593 [Marchantia paleacea]
MLALRASFFAVAPAPNGPDPTGAEMAEIGEPGLTTYKPATFRFIGMHPHHLCQ